MAAAETTTLQTLDKARQMLAEARTLPEIKKVRNVAEAARVYARAAHLGREAQNHAGEIKLLAERKAGEILKQLERGHGPGRGKTSDNMSDVLSEYTQALEETQTNERTARRWQELADVPETTIRKYVAIAQESEEDVTTNGLMRFSKNGGRKVARKAGFTFAKTPSDIKVLAASSALQKCIRRGEVRKARYFAAQIDKAGYPRHVWKRLFVISSEDVSLANNELSIMLEVLYTKWTRHYGPKKTGPTAEMSAERLFLMHAVTLAALSGKWRGIDHGTIIAYESPETYEVREEDKEGMAQAYDEAEKFDIEAWMKSCPKTEEGVNRFFDVGGKLVNRVEVDVEDPEEEARATRLASVSKKRGKSKTKYATGAQPPAPQARDEKTASVIDLGEDDIGDRRFQLSVDGKQYMATMLPDNVIVWTVDGEDVTRVGIKRRLGHLLRTALKAKAAAADTQKVVYDRGMGRGKRVLLVKKRAAGA